MFEVESGKFLEFFGKVSSKQREVFSVLADRKWHCRSCNYTHIAIDQIAGGGGIQGLQRGTKSRPGIEILSTKKYCPECTKSTHHDQWSGRARFNSVAGDLPNELKDRIAIFYEYKDPFTGTTLSPTNSIVDHRFPRIRWGTDYEPPMQSSVPDKEIYAHYQLLRNSNDNNENLRKSRACENCFETGIRQSPINGIDFFYVGDMRWPSNTPKEGATAMSGCVGCGWFNIGEWKRIIGLKLGTEK